MELLEFKLNNGTYAFNIDNIVEIIKAEEIHNIPNNQEFIEGIVNVRGKICSAINVGKLFEIKDFNDYKFFIILDNVNNSYNYVFPISEVSDIIKVDNKDKIEVSGILSSSKFIDFFINYNDNIISVLDCNKIFSSLE